VLAVIYLAKKDPNYPNVATMTLKLSEIMELRISVSLFYPPCLISGYKLLIPDKAKQNSTKIKKD
jgi:hypothetical protein